MDYVITGVGGQGTVLASKIIADILMNRGEKIHSAETIGMAQRGGSVVSYVRTGNVLSPLVPKNSADVLIGFEPAESLRCLPYLKKDGTAVISASPVLPAASSLGNGNYDLECIWECLKNSSCETVIIDTDKICSELGSYKVLNICLLGAAAATGRIDITLDELNGALLRNLPERILGINQTALQKGAAAPRL